MINILIDQGGEWHMGLFIGLSLMILFCVPRHWDWSWKALWCYSVFFCIYTLFYPWARYGTFDHAFKGTCGEALAMIVLIPFAIERFSKYFKPALNIAALYTIFVVWLHQDGMFSALSFNTSFLALSIPFLHPLFMIISLITILFHHGSTALLILAFEMIPVILLMKNRILNTILATATLIPAAYLHRTDDYERLIKWGNYLKFWAGDIRQIFFGTGAGSFIWFSLRMEKPDGHIFMNAHNDFIQLLFEYGLIGLILGLVIYYKAIVRKIDMSYFAATLGMFPFMMFYHPLHYFPSALLIAYIIWGDREEGEIL